MQHEHHSLPSNRMCHRLRQANKDDTDITMRALEYIQANK